MADPPRTRMNSENAGRNRSFLSGPYSEKTPADVTQCDLAVTVG